MKIINKKIVKYLFSLLLICTSIGTAVGQDGSAKAMEEEKEDDGMVRFNGLGRVNLLQTGIDGDILEGDTTTPRSLTDGEFLLDLQINATPNKNTEVQSILRLRNEFGGFFGAGQSIEVRELWARGIIANVIEYRVGDMDIEMSPYTFYNNFEEGMVNEPAAFVPQKELIYYEQFYGSGNTRRMQGANLEFGLKFNKILRDVDIRAFMARVRGTDFFTVPTRWVSGGDLKFSTMRLSDSLGTRANFGLNLIHTFDDLQSGEANNGIRNTVFTFNFDLIILEDQRRAFHLLGETGLSNLVSKNDSITFYESDDTFVDIGLKYDFKPQKVSVFASFSDVGPDFFSMGAQSKRVDFNAQKFYYDRVGNEQAQRNVNLFDLSRDRAIYTYQLSDKLMTYDPRFSNTFPYGKSTPNRRGVNLGADYGTEMDKIEAKLDAAIMSEIRGQGTNELKDFTLVKAAAAINIHQYIDWKNKLKFTLGYQFESTNRGGVEVEQVDLQSNLIELGIEAELFKGFEILLGAKLMDASGSDYIPRIDEFNVVTDFPNRYVVDDTETLLAAGLKYNFKKDIYITLQYHSFAAQRNVDGFLNYNLDQVFVLYTMKF